MPAVASTTETTLPENLYDTYRQSKAGTTEFLTWLVEEAAAAGHRSTSKALSQQAKAPRLKGKERILQKKATARPTVERYTLVTDEILPLARKLAKHKTSVQIPQAVLHLIQKVIKARQRCTAWYEKQSTKNQSLRQSNQTHAYFTNVLVGTLEVLKPKKDTTTIPSRGVKCEEKKPDDHHNNIFDYLGLEETGLQVVADKAECNDTVSVKNPTPRKDAKRKVYEAEVSENVGFAVFCMLEDLERLRLYIRQSWEKYRVKEISIMNVSVCTNTALEFARQIETDFSQRFPKFAEYTAVLQYLHPETDWLGDLKRKFTGQQFRPELVPDTCPTHSLYFFPFLELILYTEFGCGIPQIDDIYDPRSDASGLERNEQWRRDHILLQQLLRAFPPSQISSGAGLVTTDEITEGLRYVTRTKSIRLWIILGLQIQLDIHHILGNCPPCVKQDGIDRFLGFDAARGFQELHSSAKRIKEMLTAHLHFHNKMGGHLPEPMLCKIDVIFEMLDKAILSDILRYDRLESFGSRPFMLLSMQPLLCGLLHFSFLLATQHLGLIVARQHGAITAVAHLCNAAKQEKGIPACWQELEELIALWYVSSRKPPLIARSSCNRCSGVRGLPLTIWAVSLPEFFVEEVMLIPRCYYRTPEKIYVGPPPTDPDTYDRRYYLMEGVPAHFFAPDRRAICSPSNKNRRDPFKITPVLDALFWRYCQLEDYNEISAERFEILLNTKARNPSSRQNVPRNQNLSPVQLLALLESALTMDEPLMQIDYLGMHKKCMDMLRRIEGPLREPLICHIEHRTSKKIKGRFDMVPNAALHAIPTFLFDFYRNAGSKGPVDSDSKIWLSTVHKIIEDFIEQENSVRKKEKEKEEEKAAAVDEEPVDSLPILKTARAMGILEPGPHPTIDGKCIHFGLCSRQMLQGFCLQASEGKSHLKGSSG